MRRGRSVLAVACFAVGLIHGAEVRAQGPPIPIPVPIPPPQITNTYAAKFICGVQPDRDITHTVDAQAGRYASKINVHNNTGMDINFRKKVIPLRGGQVATNPADLKFFEKLSEDQALECVCADIYKQLGVVIQPGQIPPYLEGFVIFEVFQPFHTPAPPPDPLDVEGIYTYRGELPGSTTQPPSDSGVSIEVVVYPAKSNGHVMH